MQILTKNQRGPISTNINQKSTEGECPKSTGAYLDRYGGIRFHSGADQMYLDDLGWLEQVSARDRNPEIKILQQNVPTLVFCPIMRRGECLIQHYFSRKIKKHRDLFRQIWGFQTELWVSRDAAWRVSMTRASFSPKSQSWDQNLTKDFLDPCRLSNSWMGRIPQNQEGPCHRLQRK